MFSIIKRFIYEFKEYIVLIILLIISLLLLSLNEHSAIRGVKRISFGSFALLTSTFDNLLSYDNTANAELRKRNAELMLQLNKYRRYKNENEKLKSLLEFRDTTSYPLESARVISRLLSVSEGNLILNTGKKDSVFKGMPVINDRGLVGLVTDATQDFSLVRLLLNSNFKVSVKDQRSGVDGILAWNGRKLIMKNVPTTYDLEVGDRVITSDYSTIIPPAIPVGLITKKETTVTGMLSDIVVTPFVDFSSIQYAFVLKLVPSKQVDSLELNLFRND
jgi:rod shape-determining protein MreC